MFFTGADGHAYEPIIIHQGPDGEVSQSSLLCGDEMRDGIFLKYLPTSWMVRQSVSGYMTKLIWQDTAVHLINTLPRRRPYVLYIDGYGAHWDALALQTLLDSGIYPTFLRSQNSENDQPNDNGPNARLKGIYAGEVATFMAADPSRRVQRFQPAHFNHCFKEGVGSILVRTLFRNNQKRLQKVRTLSSQS